MSQEYPKALYDDSDRMHLVYSFDEELAKRESLGLSPPPKIPLGEKQEELDAKRREMDTLRAEIESLKAERAAIDQENADREAAVDNHEKAPLQDAPAGVDSTVQSETINAESKG